MPSFTLAAPVHTELVIKKSRFLGSVQPVADRAAAMQVLAITRAEHATAAHVCWALLAGGESGMSDDGEPSGTAGRPILEVLRHQAVDGVLAVVVRYYGGIKLGAGGLVRAYTDAIAKAMQQAVLTERRAMTRLLILAEYADEARIRHWLSLQGYVLVNAEHSLRVHLVIEIPHTASDQVIVAVRDITQGRSLAITEPSPESASLPASRH